MKAMGKVTLILGLMIIVSLFLTSCSGVVTPEISMGNSNNPSNNSPNSNNYQNPSTDPVEEQVTEDTEETGTENPQKWSGLTGFVEWYGSVSGAADTWLANGFTEIRDLRDYQDTINVNGSKAAVLAANAKGLKFIWGVSAQSITAENWPTFRQAILDAAQWAQDNDVYEFQLGNEEEFHVDGTTMTVAQIITNLKSLATEVKKIFTNGNVSYSCGNSYIDDWITAGKGDIDMLASNIYMEYGEHHAEPWKDSIDALVSAFGTNGTYITEFGPNPSGLDYYSTDEAVQAAAVTEMIEYMEASGMERALFYCWQDYPGGLFGVVKADGTYRLLWNQALLNTGPSKSITVPVKTATISSSNTIALIPKVTR